MTHSGKLQNVTHVDIIKMGMQFEAELKERLKEANKGETLNDILAIRAEHAAEIQKYQLEMKQQADDYENKLKEKEDSLDKRVRLSHDQWMRDIEVVIKSRCKAAVIEANEENDAKMEKLLAEMTARHAAEKEQLEETHQSNVRQSIAVKNEQTNEIRLALVAELEAAKREISKLKYSEMERTNYTDELVADIKLNLSEKHDRIIEELEDKFEDERTKLKGDISKLEASLKEKEVEIEKSEKETQRSIKRREELLEKYRDYIHHTRPELTPGQIDFMFEFP